jgi:hypothetical protein
MAAPAGIYLGNNVGLKITTGATTLDITAFISSITLTQTFDELDVTTMQNTSHVMAKGLESGTLQVNFLNDWSASSVCSVLQTAYGTTATATMIAVKATSGTTTASATNPIYTVSILINNLTPLGTGGPGDITQSSITWTCNSSIVQTTSGTFAA